MVTVRLKPRNLHLIKKKKTVQTLRNLVFYIYFVRVTLSECAVKTKWIAVWLSIHDHVCM